MSIDRDARRFTAGTLVTLFEVRRLERYAAHLTVDGHLYEFDEGRFLLTNLIEDDPRREPFADDSRCAPRALAPSSALRLRPVPAARAVRTLAA